MHGYNGYNRCRIFLLLFLLLLLCGAVGTAQSNLLLDEYLEKEKADLGRSVYLVLNAAGMVEEDDSVESCLETLKEQGWKIKNIDIDIDKIDKERPIKLGEFSLLLMKAFNMKGGVMYSLLPWPRYACRELAFLGLIKGKALSYRTLSGEEAVRILGRFLESKEENS